MEKFKNYLIEKGYSKYTPSGNPSTVYDYTKRVNKISEREKISLNMLASNISYYVERYDTNGEEAEYGRKSHNAYINALKRFKEFIVDEY